MELAVETAEQAETTSVEDPNNSQEPSTFPPQKEAPPPVKKTGRPPGSKHKPNPLRQHSYLPKLTRSLHRLNCRLTLHR